jgi:hypothetical protein
MNLTGCGWKGPQLIWVTMVAFLGEAEENNEKPSDRIGCVLLPFKYKSEVMTLPTNFLSLTITLHSTTEGGTGEHILC